MRRLEHQSSVAPRSANLGGSYVRTQIRGWDQHDEVADKPQMRRRHPDRARPRSGHRRRKRWISDGAAPGSERASRRGFAGAWLTCANAATGGDSLSRTAATADPPISKMVNEVAGAYRSGPSRRSTLSVSRMSSSQTSSCSTGAASMRRSASADRRPKRRLICRLWVFALPSAKMD